MATVAACLVSLAGSVLIVRSLRRAGEERGGMAGAMAPHASPDLDRSLRDEEPEGKSG